MKKSSLKNYIAFLEADAAANADARNYWMRKHELKYKELLEAKDEIAELKRRLDANSWICALRASLREDNERLREDNERLSKPL